MRTQYISEISVSYPEEVVAAYDKNKIWIEGFTGTAIQMTVTNNSTNKSVEEKRSPFEGKCFFDLAYYLQVLNENDDLGKVDYESYISDNRLSAKYSVSLSFLDGALIVGTHSFDVLALWAAKLPPSKQSLIRFIGYPFTISVFTPAKSNVSFDEISYSAPSESCNVPVYKDYSSDVVFTTEEQTIMVKAKSGCGDIYLRWIDLYGRYCYWLFRSGNVTTGVKKEAEFVRFNKEMTGIKSSFKKVSTSVDICAPLVDDETFSFLLGCILSPMVDMYSNGEWVNVDIDGSSIVHENVMLQDFVVSLVLPETNMQKL